MKSIKIESKFLFVLFQSKITFVGQWNHIYGQKEKIPHNFWMKFENSDRSGDLKQPSQNRHRVTLSIKTKQLIFLEKFYFHTNCYIGNWRFYR